MRTEIIRLPAVIKAVGLGRSSVYLLIKNDPDFPRPFKLGARAVGFSAQEIEHWITQRPRSGSRNATPERHSK
jgi:prophage regulatory protein